MTSAQMVRCFDEWMRRVVEEPSRFEREFERIGAALAERRQGCEPTYGETSSAYMQQLAEECPIEGLPAQAGIGSGNGLA